MKIRKSIWMLGTAAVLASCSQEEVLQGTDNNGLATITVQLEDGMKTRAVAADEGENTGIDRYVFEAYESDGTTPANIFNDGDSSRLEVNGANPSVIARLDKAKTYKIYCWADEGEDDSSYNVESGLADITLKDGATPTIAHRGEADVNGTATDVTINLIHAVGKVVLQTTSDITNASVTVSTSTCTGYNALTGTYDTESLQEITESITDKTTNNATTDDPQEVLSFYTLVDEQVFTTTITYNNNNNYNTTLENVPYRADYRTVLRGDLYGMQYGNATVTAALDEDWEESEATYPQAVADGSTNTITTYHAGQIAAYPSLIPEAINGGNALAVVGPMNDNDIDTIANYLDKSVSNDINLDLSKAELSSIPDEAFYNVDNVGVVALPENLTTIENYALTGVKGITNWEDLTSLEKIRMGAFKGCTFSSGYDDIVLPANLTVLGTSIFQNSNISSIEIPATIQGIWQLSFANCPNLKSIVCKGNVADIQIDAFKNSVSLETIDLSACTKAPSDDSTTGGNYISGTTGSENGKDGIVTILVNKDAESSFLSSDQWSGSTTVIQVKE